MKKATASMFYALGIACFGAIGLFRTWSGLNAQGASLLRGVFGAAVLATGALLFNRRVFTAAPSYWLRCLAWGSLMGTAVFAYFKAMDHSDQSVAALFLSLQMLWFPVYTKAILPREAARTRCWVYIPVNVLTLFGTLMALGFFGTDSSQQLNPMVVTYGLMVSFLGFVYFVIGRWLFSGGNPREDNLLRRILNKVRITSIADRLARDDQATTEGLTEFWVSYQKTMIQSIGMVLVVMLYIPYDKNFFRSLLQPQALLNGFFLGFICMALAFLLITFADSVNIQAMDGSQKRIGTVVKGLSQQIELILALLLGYYLLGERIGHVGFAGCLLLLTSYVMGVLWSERSES